MRTKSRAFCGIDHLELRRLLSTIYVSAAAPGVTQDGASWATAFTSLQSALAVATAGATIDVGQGIYKPTATTDRTASFGLISGVSILGGYEGYGAANPDTRDPAVYTSTLSGDIGTTGTTTDNSYHVVYAGAMVGSTAVLDGFTISGGNANSASLANGNDGGGILSYKGNPSINDCIISDDTASHGGGGIANVESVPVFNDCTLRDNTAEVGGGIFNYGINHDAPVLNECALSGNTASASGGGMYNYGSSAVLNDCTISGNIVSHGLKGGGAICDASASHPKLTNCILWGDTSNVVNTGEVYNTVGSSATITYSDIDQSGYAGANNDIDADPLFVRNVGTSGTSDFGNLHLTGASPAINAGSNAAIPSGISTDLDGNARIVEGTVDMGAYEAFPTHLLISTQPEPGATDTAGADIPLVIDIEDQYGDIFAADSSTIASGFVASPAGATLGGTSSVTAQNGVATFNAFFLTQAGSYALSFSNGSLPAAISNGFTIGSGAGAMLAFVNQPANTVAGQTLSPVTVAVEDQYGNVVTSDTSSATLASTPAGISGSGAANQGIATFSNLSSTTAGTYTLTASDGALTATSTSFTISPAAPAALSVSQQPSNGLTFNALSPVAIQVTDQYGNLVDGASVTLAPASGPSAATLGGTLTVATTGGLATFNDLTLDRAGSYTLSASNGNLSPVTTSSFTITYAGPQLVFVAEPASATAGAKIPAIRVSPEDINGNPLTTNKSKITLTLSSGGKLIGSATGAVKTGAAIFSNLSIQKAGTYTLTATDPTFGSATSTTFTISAAAATKIVFNPQPGNSSASTPFNVSVELVDKYGNAVSDGSTVDLVLGSHPKTATSLNLSTSVADGSADFDGVTLDTAGNYTFKASDGKAKATSKKFVVS